MSWNNIVGKLSSKRQPIGRDRKIAVNLRD